MIGKFYITKFFAIFFILLLYLQAGCKDSHKNEIDVTKLPHTKSDSSSQQVEPKPTHIAIITTSLGKIKIELYGNEAPLTVNNFVSLAKKGYYNGILIHRVAKNFVIQMGDPLTKFKSKKSEWGTGGVSIYGETFQDEINLQSPLYKTGYQYGVVAMANRGPNTNTSQFFICLDEAKDLDYEWTIFGKVIDGFNTLEKINSVEVEPSSRGINDGIPKKPIKILSIKIYEVKNDKDRL